MQDSTHRLLSQVISLPPSERAALVEGIIASLDRPDPSLDALWLKEAEERLAAYDAGELEAIDADQIFAELGRNA
jgi:putative addiction module component (TIGR02574 family)